MTRNYGKPNRVPGGRPLRRCLAGLAALLCALGLSVSVMAQQSNEEATADDEQSSTPDREAVSSPEKRLRFLLKGHEYVPDRSDLEKIGTEKEVARLLRRLAGDVSLRPSIRLRAVDLLRHFERPDVVSYLEGKLTPVSAVEKAEPGTMQRQMAHHAMNTLAALRGEKALPVLTPYLESDELQLKLTAISAIGAFGGEAGAAKLRTLRKRSDSEAVLLAIDRALD